MSGAAASATDAGPSGNEAALVRAVRLTAWRIIPFLSLAYLVNFLDRTSVSFAALQMNKALGLTASQFGFGAGILFTSYCLLEVPSNLAMYRVGARRWIARIMITWGITAGANAFVTGPLSFYAVRFLLGAFEAGFFPGVIWYISIWFPARQRTNALALFIAAAPLSQLVGGPISASLLQLDGLAGLAGWQWMFLIEAVPAVLLGLVCLVFLADTPRDARWLDAEARAELLAAIAADPQDRPRKDLLGAMLDPRCLVSALIVFCYTAGSYGLSLWLPLILKGHALSTMAIGWLSAVPFLFATASTFGFAWLANRTGQKILVLLATLVLGLAGMLLAVFFPSLEAAMVFITLGLCGVISSRAIFFTIPQVFLSAAAAAGGIAFINAIGSLGGFFGPVMVGWLKDATGGYGAGMWGMAALLVVAMGLAGLLKAMVRNA